MSSESNSLSKTPEEGVMDDHAEVLDLSTVHPDRERIRIRTPADPDGKLYELAVPGDFGIAEMHGLENRFLRLDKMWEKRSDLTDKQAIDLEVGLAWLTRQIVRDAPDDVIAALTAMQQLQVAQAFINASGITVANGQPEAEVEKSHRTPVS